MLQMRSAQWQHYMTLSAIPEQPPGPTLGASTWRSQRTQRPPRKLAWVNPVGGHLGRSEAWPDSRIQAEVVRPWLMRQLGVEPKQQ